MTGDGNGELPVFVIDISGQIAKEIKQILLDAAQTGIESEVRLALKTMVRRLRQDPLGFGELVKEYKQLKILEHVAVVKPLAVRFGIHLDSRLVIISRVRLLSAP